VSYAYNPPYSVTRRPNGPPMFDPAPVPIRSIDAELGTGNFIDAAGVSATTGSQALDNIIKWGFWIGMGLVAYRMYRVLRYNDPLIQPRYKLPPAWQANSSTRTRVRFHIKDLSPEEIEVLRHRAISLYEKGTSVLSLANYLGINKNTLTRWLKEAGVYEAAHPGRSGRSHRMEGLYRKALKSYVPGKPVGSLARDLGVSIRTIIDWMKEAGVYEPAPVGRQAGVRMPFRRRAQTSTNKEKKRLLLEEYEPGMNISRLAEDIGVSYRTARNWLVEAGVYKPAPVGRPSLYREAIKRYVPGEPVAPLARDLGVDPTTIIDWMKKAGVYKPAPMGRPRRRNPSKAEVEGRGVDWYDPRDKEWKFLPYGPFDMNPVDEPELHRVCGWCKRLFVDGEWVVADPPDEWVTHGICEECNERFMREIELAEQEEERRR
jgi:transposase-like protein